MRRWIGSGVAALALVTACKGGQPPAPLAGPPERAVAAPTGTVARWSLRGIALGPSAEILSNNGSSVVSHHGADLISDNGGGLVSRVRSTAYGLAQATPPGVPVAGAHVAVLAADGTRLVPTDATTDALGRYAIDVPASVGPFAFVRASYQAQGFDITLLAVVVFPRGPVAAAEVGLDPATTLLAKKLSTALQAGRVASASLDAAAIMAAQRALATVLRPAEVAEATLLGEADAARAFDRVSDRNPALAGPLAAVGLATTPTPPPPPTPAASITPLAPSPLPTRVDTIDAVAGSGEAGALGDGARALAAQLDRPTAMALDASGNLYIVDANNRKVRRVTPGGIISSFAGTGMPGVSGDGGPATAALFDAPSAVALDAAGNLYVADYNNHDVRKVGTTGIITTFAGVGTAGSAGDGGPATAAQLDNPCGMAWDHVGNLYIADRSNHKIRQVAPDGTIRTFAGSGVAGSAGDLGAATSAQFNAPVAVALDAASNLYVADYFNNKIRKVTPGGIVSTWVGTGAAGASGDGGPATAAQLAGPNGVAVDAAGNLYIADLGNDKIRKVTPGGIISTFAGAGAGGATGSGVAATDARLDGAYGVALDAAGNLYLTATNINQIRKVTAR